jgi:integrase
MRLRLDLPKEYQLYSLRDTGIVDLLRQNTPVNDVMLQAGHSSLDMTTVYIKHFLPQGIENIKNKKQDF